LELHQLAQTRNGVRLDTKERKNVTCLLSLLSQVLKRDWP
jgi:hypothetical protein